MPGLEAIVDRGREIDLSPRLQKIATLQRPLAPELIDRQIYAQVTMTSSALASLTDELRGK